jgi:hypothetical protein
MAISRVPGFSLLANLDRQGTDLYISSNGQTLTYFDVNNYRFGINNPSPQYELDILGNVQIGSGHLYTSANISFDIGTTTTWWRNFYVRSIIGQEVTVSGNVSAQYFLGDGSQLSGIASSYGNTDVGTYLQTYNGIITASNVTVNGNVTAQYLFGDGSQLSGMYSNVQVATYLPTHTGIITASNIAVNGNITAQYFYGNGSQITGLPAGYSNVQVATYLPTHSGVITAGNVYVSGPITSGNITVSDTTIASNSQITISTVADGNIYLSAGGSGLVQIVGNDALGLPAGNTLQRPTNVSAGYIRFNTDTTSLETFDGSTWEAGTASLTSQVLNGDGVSNSFVLSSTVASETDLIVSINGTLQQPTTAYTVNGTNITFTEIPVAGDTIEVRHIATGITSVAALALGTSNISIPASSGSINLYTNGNLAVQIGTTGAIIGTYPDVAIAFSGVATNVDVFSTTVYRTAKYIFQANTGSAYESSEVLVTHDGSTAYRTVYAVISSGASLGNVSATVNGTNVLVQYTAANNNTNVRTLKHYVVI